MNPLTQSKNTTIRPVLIALMLACFALSPQAQATCREGCDTSNLANTFLGNDALVNSESGLDNTAIGSGALEHNMGTFFTGSFNTAVGAGALTSNTTGSDNTATGDKTLEFNTTGSGNTAVGETALNSNTIGSSNIAVGSFALFNNISGNSNIAVGNGTGQNLTMGSNNIYIGNDIGAGGGFTPDESNRIRIGGVAFPPKATFIGGISGVPVNGSQVVIGAGGRLGVTASSVRFKDEIKSMGKTSEAILVLKPVTFRYKKELDPQGTQQWGLVAEDVEKVNPDLVVRDNQGKPCSVRYDQVNAMLLNEFLKEHRKVEQMQKQIEALTAGLQKVSAQLEVSKSAPQTVLNSQ